MTAITRKIFTAVFVLSLCSFPSQPQNPQSQPARPLVKVRVSLTDQKGRAVAGAKKDDFQIVDDGTPEVIEYFGIDEEPIAYGLVIDASGSLKFEFQKIVAAARQLINANRERDQTFIIKFVSSDNIRTIQEITSNKTALDASLTNLKVEMGQTAVIDGVYLAAQYAMKHNANRPTALVLLSDGEDRASYYRDDQLFSLLEKSSVQVYPVGVIGQLDSTQGLVRLSPQQKAMDLLTKLAKKTGGLAFILNSAPELPSAIEQLNGVIRSQYIIGYRPTKQPGEINRKVKIKVVDSPTHEKWTVVGSRIIRTESNQP